MMMEGGGLQVMISEGWLQIYAFIVLNMKMMLWVALLLCFTLTQGKQLLITYSNEGETAALFSLFHSQPKGFFVDVGAYDPIYASNTAGLPGWKGINVEADPQRLRSFLLARPNQINLNFALSNRTGARAQLVEFAEDSAATINPEAQKDEKNGQPKRKQSVPLTTLAELCHNYYLTRPHLLNIDTEGEGLAVLQGNDWSQENCRPEVILIEKLHPEDANNKQREFLKSQNYTQQANEWKHNELFIHNSKLAHYQTQQQAGQLLLAESRLEYWLPVFTSIFGVIAPKYEPHFENFRHLKQDSSPIYIHFAHEHIISLDKLYKDSRLANSNPRPILLLNYNPKRSRILLGAEQYTWEQVSAGTEQLHKFKVYLPEGLAILYVLDHKAGNLDVMEALAKTTRCPEGKKVVTREKIVNVDNYLG